MPNEGEIPPTRASVTDTKPRPPTSEAEWGLLREAYRKAKQDTDESDVTLFKTMEAKDNGFKIPFEVRTSPGKGRGVFSTKFLAKGTLVNEDRSGKFHSEDQWRTFLESVPHELAQDCCEWAYVEEFQGRNAVFLDFSEAAMMNHGDCMSTRQKTCPCCSTRTLSKANLKEKLINGVWCYVASREIEADEELLVDYTDFHDYDEPLQWFEDIWDEYHPDADPNATYY